MKRNVALVCLLCFLLMLGRFVLGGVETAAYSELASVDKLILVAGVIGAFAFWFLMLADFFTNKSIQNKVAWGFCLIFFSWISSAVYFVMYYLPRSKRVVH